MIPAGRSLRAGARVIVALVLLVLSVTCGCPADAAQSADWSALATTVFHSIGDVSGTSVTAVAEDGEGYLWIGGQGGLSRWDGYRFHSYTPDPQTPGSLPDTYINTLHTDRRGRLWVGTTSGGLARYDRDHDSFVTYVADRNGPSANIVNALADDDGNGLWIGTPVGLDHFIEATGTFEHFHHDARTAGSLPDNAVRALLRDHGGRLWVAMDGGLAFREPGSARFTSVALPAIRGQNSMPEQVFEDSSRRIWIGTRHHGVYLVDADRRAAHAFPSRAGSAAGALLQLGTIQSIAEPRPGEMWFGTNEHGIVALDVASRAVRLIRHDPAVSTTLPQDEIWTMYRDRSGLLWVGTMGGLRRYDPRQTAIVTIPVASNLSSGVAGADVTTAFSDQIRGRVWLGFGSEGIDIIDPRHGRLAALRPDPARLLTALPDAPVLAICASPQGPVYIGTERGLYAADPDGSHVRLIAAHVGSGAGIAALTFAGGKLWIGTVSDGLWVMDRNARDRADRPSRVRDWGQSDKQITTLLPAPDGQLLVGTYSGLSRLDLRSGAVERVWPQLADMSRSTTGFVSSLLTDRQGRIWVGTFGGGIIVVERDSAGRRHVHQLAVRQGLPNVNVDALLLDRIGRVWAATDDGLAVIDPRSLAVRALRRADGVAFSGYYLGAGVVLDDALLFGASGGVTVVRPTLERDWTYAPRVVITDVRVGGRPVPVNRRGERGALAPLTLSTSADSVAVEFSALDFSAPERNRYAYRLVGFDPDWIETDPERRTAAYTNLPPGTYTLQLRGSNRNGAWSNTTVALPIRVAPAWYQTTLFRFAAGALGIGLLLAFIHMRTAYLRRRERELEHQVSQRTVELRMLAVELRESKDRLEHFAYRDALTDLPNRRLFAQEFGRMLVSARRSGSDVALLLIDLDRFKLINDKLGHAAGDALLVEAAHRLRSVTRESDCVARLGGDEFAVLLDGHDGAAIERVCERIVQCFVTPILFHGTAMETSPSIGVAVFPRDGDSQDELYRSADLALYSAKRAGRNTWRWFGLEPA